MEYDHKSVLLAEVLEQLITNTRGTFVDCTLGGTGHARAILERLEEDSLFVGIEQDIVALDAAKIKLENFSRQTFFIKGNFRDLDRLLKGNVQSVDGFIFDLGVSSMQLDQAERGFSYKQSGPLDMRMDKDETLSAYEVVNSYSSKELFSIIRNYGEEKWASRIANFIVDARKRKKIETTEELVQIIKDAIPASARRSGPHPAKRAFQAIRIEVNDELKAIESALWQCFKWLNVGGRIVVISFHSLEDRIAKRIFQKFSEGFICDVGFKNCKDYSRPLIKKISRKPITPSEEEILSNPRARSAKMRVVEKIAT